MILTTPAYAFNQQVSFKERCPKCREHIHANNRLRSLLRTLVIRELARLAALNDSGLSSLEEYSQ
jgi:hypothetical protein